MNGNAFQIEQVRADIPALSETIYLNTGTFGPLPRVVAHELHRVYGQIHQLGTFSPLVYREMELQGLEVARDRVAELLHAGPDEIAFTHNVTDGINTVLHGLDWSPGDEVIISDQEHPAGTIPWLSLREHHGVVVRVLPVCADPEQMVSQFRRLLGPNTRLACISHVSCLSGMRLPVAQLCAVARDAGVMTLIDGAHAEGQFPICVPEIGSDFYAACGHKWLLGPQGTGFLYIRRERLEDVRAVWLGWGPNKAFDRASLRYELEPTAARFEASTQPWPLYLALGQAIEYIEGIGLANIELRVRGLVAGFRALLSAIPGIAFHTPSQTELATGLVTCSISDCNAEALGAYLWDTRRILTAHVREFNALRFSVAFFNTSEELETAAATLAAATGGGA